MELSWSCHGYELKPVQWSSGTDTVSRRRGPRFESQLNCGFFPRIPPGSDPTLHPTGVGNWVVPFPTESLAVKAIEVSIVGTAVSTTGRSFQPGYLNAGGDFL